MQKSMLDRFVEAAEKTGDITLRWYFQQREIKQNLLSPQEREQIANEAAEIVLSRISATVDASEIFDAIDGLNDKINSLGR